MLQHLTLDKAGEQNGDPVSLTSRGLQISTPLLTVELRRFPVDISSSSKSPPEGVRVKKAVARGPNGIGVYKHSNVLPMFDSVKSRRLFSVRSPHANTRTEGGH